MSAVRKVAKWLAAWAVQLLVKSWAVTTLWQWLLVPCCFLPISMPQAIGLVIMARFVMHPPKVDRLNDPLDIEVDGVVVAKRIGFNILIVTVCWPLTWMMP